MKKTLFASLLLTIAVCSYAQPACNPKGDFSFTRNPCSAFDITYTTNAVGFSNIRWLFGDGNNAAGNSSVTHTYAGLGNYQVTMIADYPSCSDTIVKMISLAQQFDAQLIQTIDTLICNGSTKQLRSTPGFVYCWSPATFLDNPNSPNPITSATQNITYTLNSISLGTNLISNGDFNLGNTGFTSQYFYTSNNTTEGEYFVGTNPSAWYFAHYACSDHTTGNGNMLLVNGSPQPNAEVWKTTVPVTPNTNYSFSTWISSISVPNPAQLAFSINGNAIGGLINASQPPCNWIQFYTTWNSGNATSAIISIINKNTTLFGNDFALDDIYFAPFTFRTDSVKITVEKPAIVTSSNLGFCIGKSAQLNTTGGNTYTWTPASGLSNTTIANPVASPSITTEYIVTGTNANNCIGKDTVIVTVNPLPTVVASKSNDIGCSSDISTLNASGAQSYSWTPATNLSNPLVANPVANPTDTTKFIVTGTDANGCINKDSVTINVSITGQSLYLMPTAFTPNGDGINDCYGIKYWGAIEKLDFSIYNRWGERIFRTTDPSACWDGTYKGAKQDAAVFVYVVRAVTICGEAYRKGTFALIR
jgi:gliding motility-associated-like protein